MAMQSCASDFFWRDNWLLGPLCTGIKGKRRPLCRHASVKKQMSIFVQLFISGIDLNCLASVQTCVSHVMTRLFTCLLAKETMLQFLCRFAWETMLQFAWESRRHQSCYNPDFWRHDLGYNVNLLCSFELASLMYAKLRENRYNVANLIDCIASLFVVIVAMLCACASLFANCNNVATSKKSADTRVWSVIFLSLGQKGAQFFSVGLKGTEKFAYSPIGHNKWILPKILSKSMGKGMSFLELIKSVKWVQKHIIIGKTALDSFLYIAFTNCSTPYPLCLRNDSHYVPNMMS